MLLSQGKKGGSEIKAASSPFPREKDAKRRQWHVGMCYHGAEQSAEQSLQIPWCCGCVRSHLEQGELQMCCWPGTVPITKLAKLHQVPGVGISCIANWLIDRPRSIFANQESSTYAHYLTRFRRGAFLSRCFLVFQQSSGRELKIIASKVLSSHCL